MSSKPLKILVCGDVRGKFEQLFARVNAIQKKSGVFDLLLCVGDFFGDEENSSTWQQIKAGAVKAPVAILLLGPNHSKHVKYFAEASDGVLADNITYLGHRGVYRSSSDLTIVYLSGVEQEAGSSVKDITPNDSPYFSATDVNDLQQSVLSQTDFQGVDLLLTSQWPQGIEKYGIAVEGVDTKSVGSALISQLALAVRPRYHFCALEGVSYERQPYRNHKVLQENARHVTRFIALADVGNENKRKYLYAFNIIPMKHMDFAELIKQPQDTSECPYKSDAAVFEKAKAKEPKSAQFFYDADVIERGTTLVPRGKRKPRGGGGGSSRDGQPPVKRQHPQPTGPCWFCLASPEVEKHLVVSVGTQCYLALAKGGLTEDHVLILPIGHYQSIVSAPDDVVNEIDQFKSALKKCFMKSGRSVVFFERNYKTQHLQIQAVAIPASVPAIDVRQAFEECASQQNVDLNEVPTYSDIKQIVPAGAPYFYAELPGNCKLLCRISRGFPIQFGREALADRLVLDMPDRVDWKNCQTSKAEESEMAANFRDRFKNFDFTLD